MFTHQGIYLPDGEKHFPEWMTKNGEVIDGLGTYQIKKWRACLPFVRSGWERAIDIGAHVGFWSIQMSKTFLRTEAFEPVDKFRECWVENIARGEGNRRVYGSDLLMWVSEGSGQSIVLHEFALGAAEGLVAMFTPPLDGGIDSGGTHVKGSGDIKMRTLDSFGFEDVDFVKIDCEGYEHHVIAGARETLLRCKPCVIVEQKQHKMAENYGTKGEPAVDLLRELGAHARICISGDWICSWD